ncbi:MAG: biopolymer transporter ExbD [Planctomycetota bacterium]
MKLPASRLKRARIEVIPLIDVMFLLLVTFIYSYMSASYHRAIPITLPDATTGEKPADAGLTIVIRADGALEADGQPVTRAALDGILAAAAESGRKVEVAGDRDARYADIMAVCDAVRRAGIQGFAFQVHEQGAGQP